MALRVGINGFGRIGRAVLRAAMGRPDVEIVAVNDLADARTMAHLLWYDSIHGTLNADVFASGERKFSVNGRAVKTFNLPGPGAIPWGDCGVDIVIESSGRFTDRDSASKHLNGGAKKVVITAPAKKEDITIVMGVNEEKYDPARHHVISSASCTTNCLAPVAKVLHKEFGIIRGLMTTIHSYTNDQRILDLSHRDLRRARAAAMSIIPTTTGAAKAVTRVMPELEGKLDGMAMRVPTPNVSAVDFVVELAENASAEDINEAFKAAAEGELKGILAYSDLPLVSRDYNGDPRSSIVDGLSTMVVKGNMAKVVSWYDNEWGYSNRVVDLVAYIGKQGF